MAKKSLSKHDGPVSLGGGVDFLPGKELVMIDVEGTPGASLTTPLVKDYHSYPIVFWGSSNNYPQLVIEQAMCSPELLSLIEYLVTVIYGDGIGYEIFDPNTPEGQPPQYIPWSDPEVDAWLIANNIEDWDLQHIIDLVWFNRGFTEMIKNKAGDKICQIGHQEAAFCRMGTQNKETGAYDKVYINANWPYTAYNDPQYTTIVDAINTKSLYKVEETMESGKYKFIYTTAFPFPAHAVYPMPAWHALFTSRWFEIGKQIPILKAAMMQFQMTIKYIMEVPEEFWVIQARDRGFDWGTMTPSEKVSLKKKVKKEMDDFLTGAKNTGKTLMTTFGWDKVNKVKIPGVSIIALDDKLKDGKYIIDSKEVSGQQARSFGIPLPLMGPISAGDMGSGSGSDAWIHWGITNNRLISKKTQTLKPLNFVAQCNGWVKRLPGFRFYRKSSVLKQSDVQPSTINPTPERQDKRDVQPKPDGNTDQ